MSWKLYFLSVHKKKLYGGSIEWKFWIVSLILFLPLFLSSMPCYIILFVCGKVLVHCAQTLDYLSQPPKCWATDSHQHTWFLPFLLLTQILPKGSLCATCPIVGDQVKRNGVCGFVTILTWMRRWARSLFEIQGVPLESSMNLF